MSAAGIVPSICRNCPAFCPVLVTVADGRPVKVAGDPDTPYEGYTCPKGRAMAEQHTTPLRLLKSQKRRADGAFDPIERMLMVDGAKTIGDPSARKKADAIGGPKYSPREPLP